MRFSASPTDSRKRLERTRSAKRLHGYRVVTEIASDVAAVTVVTGVTKVLSKLKEKFTNACRRVHETRPIEILLKAYLEKPVTAVTAVTRRISQRDSVTALNLETVTKLNSGYRRALGHDFGVVP